MHPERAAALSFEGLEFSRVVELYERGGVLRLACVLRGVAATVICYGDLDVAAGRVTERAPAAQGGDRVSYLRHVIPWWEDLENEARSRETMQIPGCTGHYVAADPACEGSGDECSWRAHCRAWQAVCESDGVDPTEALIAISTMEGRMRALTKALQRRRGGERARDALVHVPGEGRVTRKEVAAAPDPEDASGLRAFLRAALAAFVAASNALNARLVTTDEDVREGTLYVERHESRGRVHLRLWLYLKRRQRHEIARFVGPSSRLVVELAAGEVAPECDGARVNLAWARPRYLKSAWICRKQEDLEIAGRVMATIARAVARAEHDPEHELVAAPVRRGGRR